ncbi:MAG: lamin tail domain-containing protein [Bacteroidota bacterium]
MGAFSRGIVFILPLSISASQIISFPFTERFDSLQTPQLPSGWETSTNRLASGDFFTTSTSPHSAPFAVQSTNSTVAQTVVSPIIDFTGRVPDQLRFYLARSGTHTSGLLVEASADGGSTWPVRCTDTLRHPGTTGYVLTVVQIAETLTNMSRVRFRWRVVGGAGGTTATLRLDDVSVSVFTSIDLAVRTFAFHPGKPTDSDDIALNLTVASLGLMQIPGFSTKFFLDHNSNGIAEDPEMFSSIDGGALSPGDSTTLSVLHPPLSAGSYRFLAVTVFAGDEDPANDTAQVVVPVGVSPGSIIVNEVMYAPPGDEPEWVELHNPTSRPINLGGWKISDNRTTSRVLLSGLDFFVPPSGFALVARDSSFFMIHDSLSASVVVTAFPSLNNTTSDAVVLTDFHGVTIDSVAYDPAWGGSGGRSLERIDYFSVSSDPSNWITSVSSSGSTPGTANSLAVMEYDIRIESAAVWGTMLGVHVVNAGRTTIHEFEITLTTLGGSAVGSMLFSGSLPRGETAFLSHNWTEAPSGRTSILISANLKEDERPMDNIDTVEVTRGYPSGCLLINEIMYEPLADQNEWIELINPGDVPVKLAGWMLSDAPTASGGVNRYPLSQSITIEPGEFAVFAADSTILMLFPALTRDPRVHILNQPGGLGLANTGDGVILKDLTGMTIDSVRYSPSWHHPTINDPRGRSLERIRPDLGSNDPRNWSTSAGTIGGSPGSRNTLFTPAAPSGSSLSFSPNPFSPDGDGHEDFCIVRFAVPIPSSVIRIRIFDLRGRVIRTLAEAEPAGSIGEVIWDGMESAGRKARIGPHIVLLEASGVNGEIFTAKGVVIVATAL